MKNIFENSIYIKNIPFCSDCSSVRQISPNRVFEIMHDDRRSIVFLSELQRDVHESVNVPFLHMEGPCAVGCVGDGVWYRIYDYPADYALLSTMDICNGDISKWVFSTVISCLKHIHMCDVTELVQHDYFSMLEQLIERYEAQPVRFTDDFSIFRFMRKHVMSIVSMQVVPVVAGISKDNVLISSQGDVIFLSGQSGIELGHNYYDIASLAYAVGCSDMCVYGSICTCTEDMMDMYWFVFYSYIGGLVDAVDTCDEAAINVVQRKLSNVCDDFKNHHFRF